MKNELLASNGKPTNLSPTQYRLVRTPAFKRWFGDFENDPENASKVVDENGEPLVVYHRTKLKFYEFSSGSDLIGWLGRGFYFSPNKNEFKEYGRSVLTCFLNIKNLFVSKGEDSGYLYSEVNSINKSNFFNQIDIAQILKENGYNGVLLKHWDRGVIITCFEPNQIKLADGTNTYFDDNNTDIRFENGGNVSKELYHYTSEINFDRIFDSNILNPSQKYGNRLSFTSDSEYHKKEHGLDYRKTNVRITFDNEKLISDGYSFSQFDHSSKQDKIGKEFEYIIRVPIKNVKKYIKNITIFKGNAIVGQIDKTATDYANKYYLNSDILYEQGGLLAPNGKPSNLNAIQYKLVRTPAFKKWFGDWEKDLANASKVVDENGEPLIVYHGTDSFFDKFKHLQMYLHVKKVFIFLQKKQLLKCTGT